MTTTGHIYSSSITKESLFFPALWDSFHNINTVEGEGVQDSAAEAAALPIVEISLTNNTNFWDDGENEFRRIFEIIESAEDVMSAIPHYDNFFEQDIRYEPTPIGPSGIQKIVELADTKHNGIKKQQADLSLTSVMNRSLKRLADQERDDCLTSFSFGKDHDQQCRKKQRLSSCVRRPILVRSATIEQEEPSNIDTAAPKKETSSFFSINQAEQWMERFEDLVQFEAKMGHCLVPHTYPPNQKLAQWIKRQRYQYKLKMSGRHSTLTDARQKELEDMGFVWESHKAAWQERLETLKVFQARYGHCMVPTKSEEDKPLAIWVKCQRRQLRLFRLGQRSTMTAERFEELEKLGFKWNPRNL